jgi:hypothetical protein
MGNTKAADQWGMRPETRIRQMFARQMSMSLFRDGKMIHTSRAVLQQHVLRRELCSLDDRSPIMDLRLLLDPHVSKQFTGIYNRSRHHMLSDKARRHQNTPVL